MKNKKVRYHDDQIKEMLNVGFGSRTLRQCHISPKRIARISRGEIARSPGRPIKITNEQKMWVSELVQANPYIKAKEIQEKYLEKFSKTISTGSISEILKNSRIYYGSPIKIQSLKPFHVSERFNFAIENINNNLQFFQRIIFTDECRFSNSPDSLKIYRKKGVIKNEYCITTEKFSISCMAWGAIGLNFKPDLFFFDEKVNAENYVQMLKDTQFFEKAQDHYGGIKFYFQQDGATCHTKDEVIDFIIERSNLLCGWPANSPDLSPIEMLWSIVKYRISKYENLPKTKEELKIAVQNEWKKIDMNIVNRLVLSFKKRLIMCRKVWGKSISHFLKYKKYEIPEYFVIAYDSDLYIFTEQIDNQLLLLQDQSFAQIGKVLNMHPRLAKYRLNYLINNKKGRVIQKKLLVQTNKTLLNFRGNFFMLPEITLPKSDNDDEDIEFTALETFPIIAYYKDKSDNSDSDEES